MEPQLGKCVCIARLRTCVNLYTRSVPSLMIADQDRRRHSAQSVLCGICLCPQQPITAVLALGRACLRALVGSRRCYNLSRRIHVAWALRSAALPTREKMLFCWMHDMPAPAPQIIRDQRNRQGGHLPGPGQQCNFTLEETTWALHQRARVTGCATQVPYTFYTLRAGLDGATGLKTTSELGSISECVDY